MINVHPSLLPDFAGGMDVDVHTAVLAAQRKVSGCTVHFVSQQVDGGDILIQKSCAVAISDTPQSLKCKVQALEAEVRGLRGDRYVLSLRLSST
jgi:folate-dependent phosphoribosylglycinamide formyltransferase PurN